jgi:hypothetical protein
LGQRVEESFGMPPLLISTLIFLLLLVGSCSSQPSEPKPASQPRDAKTSWSLDLKTSGGFVGVGRGNLSVSHEGRFECSPADRQQVKKGVSGTLNPSQLKPISDAVAQLNPKGWNKPGLNVSAADAFGYKLEYRPGAESSEVFTVQWYDNTTDQLPDDLKKLSDVLLRTMGTSCGGTP